MMDRIYNMNQTKLKLGRWSLREDLNGNTDHMTVPYENVRHSWFLEKGWELVLNGEHAHWDMSVFGVFFCCVLLCYKLLLKLFFE